jgi:hypothetical protein
MTVPARVNPMFNRANWLAIAAFSFPFMGGMLFGGNLIWLLGFPENFEGSWAEIGSFFILSLWFWLNTFLAYGKESVKGFKRQVIFDKLIRVSLETKNISRPLISNSYFCTLEVLTQDDNGDFKVMNHSLELGQAFALQKELEASLSEISGS